jgi:hypothetical protein
LAITTLFRDKQRKLVPFLVAFWNWRETFEGRRRRLKPLWINCVNASQNQKTLELVFKFM